jgi:hypothetical protein
MAEQPLPSEDQVKAAFLVNFPKYVDWPPGTFPGPASPIVIAVLGETVVADEVEKAIAGRTVNGRRFVLNRVRSGEDPGLCHILFIPAAEQRRSPNLFATLKGAVLTVGESDDFLDRGGIINLILRDRAVAIEVSLASADRAVIKVSSNLLRVASVVKGKPR